MNLEEMEVAARHVLNNVGDEEFEWREENIKGVYRYLHLRRRATKEEEKICGEPKDIRQTSEFHRRLSVIQLHTNMSMRAMIELETHQASVYPERVQKEDNHGTHID